MEKLCVKVIFHTQLFQLSPSGSNWRPLPSKASACLSNEFGQHHKDTDLAIEGIS